MIPWWTNLPPEYHIVGPLSIVLEYLRRDGVSDICYFPAGAKPH